MPPHAALACGGFESPSGPGFSHDAVRANATGIQIRLRISRISSSITGTALGWARFLPPWHQWTSGIGRGGGICGRGRRCRRTIRVRGSRRRAPPDSRRTRRPPSRPRRPRLRQGPPFFALAFVGARFSASLSFANCRGGACPSRCCSAANNRLYADANRAQ